MCESTVSTAGDPKRWCQALVIVVAMTMGQLFDILAIFGGTSSPPPKRAWFKNSVAGRITSCIAFASQCHFCIYYKSLHIIVHGSVVTKTKCDPSSCLQIRS